MPAFVANSNVLEISGLSSEVTGAFINDATVEVTVKNSDDEAVAGMTWPAAMAYIALSDGIYRLILEDDLALVHGQKYKAFIEVDAGIDRTGHWEFSFKAQTRAVAD